MDMVIMFVYGFGCKECMYDGLFDVISGGME